MVGDPRHAGGEQRFAGSSAHDQAVHVGAFADAFEEPGAGDLPPGGVGGLGVDSEGVEGDGAQAYELGDVGGNGGAGLHGHSGGQGRSVERGAGAGPVEPGERVGRRDEEGGPDRDGAVPARLVP